MHKVLPTRIQHTRMHTSQYQRCIITNRELHKTLCVSSMRICWRIPGAQHHTPAWDKLWLTTEDRAQHPTTRNVSFTGRAKHWHQLSTNSLVWENEEVRRWERVSPARTGNCIKGIAHGKWTLNGNKVFEFNFCEIFSQGTYRHTHACTHKYK